MNKIERILALKALYNTAWRKAYAADDWQEFERIQARIHAATKRLVEIVG